MTVCATLPTKQLQLDLDGGVKVNYAAFGDLVASVQKVCGKRHAL